MQRYALYRKGNHKNMEKKKLGILGGMGSEATVLFYKKIIDNTSVNNDREHLDILIYNHASIPDRTECILCGKQDYLWDIIANDIRGMEQLGCEYFAIPCNTCHYFADRLQKLTNGKFINMIEETARYAAERGRKKVGIMATDGTVQGGMYKKAMEARGIEVVYPSKERQEDVMSLKEQRAMLGDRLSFAASEAYKLLRTNLTFALPDEQSIVMVFVAFIPKNFKKIFQELIMFYLISFLFGGCALSLLYFIKPENIIMKKRSLCRTLSTKNSNTRRITGIYNSTNSF